LYKEKESTEELAKLIKEHSEKSKDLNDGYEKRITELENHNKALVKELELERKKS